MVRRFADTDDTTAEDAPDTPDAPRCDYCENPLSAGEVNYCSALCAHHAELDNREDRP